jgi:hypothetical protein
VKVSIECHYDRAACQSETQDFFIGRLAHSDFTEMLALMSETSQTGCGVSWNALIQDQAHT